MNKKRKAIIIYENQILNLIVNNQSKNMKDDVENIVNDVKIYSEGLILAIQKDRLDEAVDYASKMTNQLKIIMTYVKMKKNIPKKIKKKNK
ncbi:hypothetical protein YTPLAS73_04480 [Nitrosarchaeum sp.]|nr:hypothetical protein YTPLAS73_04480 [Nitrosarchaeum sp.]